MARISRISRSPDDKREWHRRILYRRDHREGIVLLHTFGLKYCKSSPYRIPVDPIGKGSVRLMNKTIGDRELGGMEYYLSCEGPGLLEQSECREGPLLASNPFPLHFNSALPNERIGLAPISWPTCFSLAL